MTLNVQGGIGRLPLISGLQIVPSLSPAILVTSAGLGATNYSFGFNIFWTPNSTVIVDACTNLSNPVWQPLQTNFLNNGTFYFTDPLWTNYPGRFYRVTSQ